MRIFIHLITTCNYLRATPKAVEYHDRQSSRATLPSLGCGAAVVRVYSHINVPLPCLVPNVREESHVSGLVTHPERNTTSDNKCYVGEEEEAVKRLMAFELLADASPEDRNHRPNTKRNIDASKR